MDKEREMEKLANDMVGKIDYEVNYYSDDNYSEVIIDYKNTAKNIIEAGYGDTKQAVREFVKELRKHIDKIRHPNERVITNVLEEEYDETIDELLAEVTGE